MVRLVFCLPVSGHEAGHVRGRCKQTGQHSTQLTARPPRDVSLYLSCMSAPVSRMVRITRSREMKCLPSPRRAICVALIAFTAAMALRSMHGTCTRPPTGSQVRPRLCSRPISAAFSSCSGVAPSTSARPAAAMAQADPTSDRNQTADRVAGQAEVVFQADFGGVFQLLRRGAEHVSQTGGGHGASRSDFTLAADF